MNLGREEAEGNKMSTVRGFAFQYGPPWVGTPLLLSVSMGWEGLTSSQGS